MSTLRHMVPEFSKAHLLIAGEIGLDQYIWGDSSRISPEAPVPVIEVQSESQGLGLAANVAQNVASLGAKTTLVSVRGDDSTGVTLQKLLKSANVSRVELISDATRPTLRKVRIIARKQHVVRVDYERVDPLEPNIAKQFRERICDLLPEVDGVILQDYANGLWNDETLRFIATAKELKKPVFVDPSRLATADRYKGVTLLSPNIAESAALASYQGRIKDADRSALGKIAQSILKAAEAEHVIITCGSQGMLVASKNAGQLKHIPTFAREVFDVTGAGDTVIAVLGLSYVLQMPIEQCMELANAAAGLVVAKVGTATVSREALSEELLRLKSEGLVGSAECWGIV